jgi:RNA polymerase sigma-70 factor, ECF subfamily
VAAAATGMASNVESSDAPTARQGQALPQSESEDHRRARVTELMIAHGEAVFGFCMRMVHDEPTAHDVWQQTFLEAYRDLDQFGGRASMKTWLTSIARNRCLDVLKRNRRHRERLESDDEAVLDHIDPSTGPAERIDQARLIAKLEDCLRRLPPAMRATVLERFMTGSTYEELARLLRASANTLQVRVARALRILKHCLEQHGWIHE